VTSFFLQDKYHPAINVFGQAGEVLEVRVNYGTTNCDLSRGMTSALAGCSKPALLDQLTLGAV
jgi:hypothetical protein